MNIVLGLCKTLLQIITYIKVPGKKKTILRQKKTLEEIVAPIFLNLVNDINLLSLLRFIKFSVLQAG